MAILNGNILVLTPDEQVTLDQYSKEFAGYISLWLQDHLKQMMFDVTMTLPQSERVAFITAAKERDAGKVK